jgi:predicted transcriptional regulator
MSSATVGSVLRGWREARGLSVNALSQQTGIPRRTIDRVETDEACKLETFARLTVALAVDEAGVLALVELARQAEAVAD